MGYGMCLGCDNRIKLIIFFLFSFISIDVLAVAQWSKVGYVYRFSGSSSNSSEYNFSNCSISSGGSGMQEDGDPNAPRQYIQTEVKTYEMVINYGENFKDNFFADGVFKYAQKFDFGVPQNYREPLLSGLKKALNAGNCDIAQSILDTLVNGKVQNEGKDDEFLGFENGSDKCALSKDGSSVCAFNKSQTDDEGNPIIGLCGQTNCDRDTLDNYASSKSSPKKGGGNGENNSGQDDSNGNGINQLKGSGGNSGSSPSGNSNNGSSSSGSGGSNGGSGSSDKGTGNGKGQGSGVGKGEGDKEDANGDLTYPELESFDIKKAFSDLKKSKEGFIPKVSLAGGNCPPLNISFNSKFLSINESIDAHCQIFKSASGVLSSIFLFIWGIISLRVILSA